MNVELYIGLMTGTSVDAIDIALCSFNDDAPQLIDACNHALNSKTKSLITTLFQPGANEIELLGRLDVELSAEYADAVISMLNRNALNHKQITAIGCHGQTLRHRPRRKLGDTSFTLQVGDPNTLAVRTGIQVVADFRRKDIALGGEGAPLAPGFHRYLAEPLPKPSAFLNIGGIANITLLNEDRNDVVGFDIGPGNALLDYWIKKHLDLDYDSKGEWAAKGKVSVALLSHLLNHPYFHLPPPKSTGKEEFTPEWLEQEIHRSDIAQCSPEDVQATLVELTAVTIAENIKRYTPMHTLYVCGGGIHNDLLMQRISARLPDLTISSTEELGIHPDWIEACAFAWLAKKRIHGEVGNIPSVTGAQHPAVLGGVWLP